MKNLYFVIDFGPDAAENDNCTWFPGRLRAHRPFAARQPAAKSVLGATGPAGLGSAAGQGGPPRAQE